MLDGIREILDQSYIEIEKVFDYSDAGKIQVIRKYGNLEIEEYREDGIFVKGTLPSEYESYCLGR